MVQPLNLDPARRNLPNVVVVGGGTGVSTVLSYLKKVANVTAIVSMMDSGGSSGRLRDEHGPHGGTRRREVWILRGSLKAI